MQYGRFDDPIYNGALATLARGRGVLPADDPALVALSAFMDKATAGTSDVAVAAEGFGNGIFLDSARAEMAARAAAVESRLSVPAAAPAANKNNVLLLIGLAAAAWFLLKD